MKKRLLGLMLLFPVWLMAQVTIVQPINGEPALEKVQTFPLFPVCEDYAGFNARQLCFQKQMDQFLAKELRMPQEAKDAGVDGWVKVQYIVEKDGSIREVTALEDPGYGCAEEVARVLRSLPRLIPGVHLGKVVRVKQMLSVQFSTPKKG